MQCNDFRIDSKERIVGAIFLTTVLTFVLGNIAAPINAAPPSAPSANVRWCLT